jgi:hypothetical protein
MRLRVEQEFEIDPGSPENTIISGTLRLDLAHPRRYIRATLRQAVSFAFVGTVARVSKLLKVNHFLRSRSGALCLDQ